MLSGRFADIPLQALQARISWDRVNNRLIARRGSRMLAVLNSGTITFIAALSAQKANPFVAAATARR